MRYNMHMHDNRYLLDLIAGRRSAVKAASVRRQTLEAALLRSMTKRAQQIVGARPGPSKYDESVRQQHAARARAAQQAAAARNAHNAGKTGLDYYDDLPNVARNRRYQAEKARQRQLEENSPHVVKKKDMATIQKEVGPVKSWGDTRLGNIIGRGFSESPLGRSVNFGGKVLGYMLSPKGTSWKDFSEQYDQTEAMGREDVGKDVANNLQLWGEGVRNGAQSVGMTAARYADPTTYGNSARAEARRRSHANRRANANMAHEARINGILNNFNDSSLKNGDQGIGKWNKLLTEGAGELLGAQAVTGGIGGAAGVAGKGIMHGTRLAANAVRGAQAASTAARAAGSAAGTASSAAGWGARAVQGARNMTARGIEGMGETLAMPFKAVSSAAGAAANPFSTAGRAIKATPGAVRTAWNGTMSVARPAGQSVAATGRAVLQGGRAAMHPVQTARSMATSTAPWRAMGGAVRDIASPAWQATKAVGRPLGKALTNDRLWQLQAAGDAGYNMLRGNYGDAASAIGDYGMLRGLGSWYLPVMLGKGMLSGGAGEY